MALYWILTGVALLLAVLAWMRIRRLTKRLERLTESYWDVRYELGQLSARVARAETASQPVQEPPGRPAGAGSFVPLSSLKR